LIYIYLQKAKTQHNILIYFCTMV